MQNNVFERAEKLFYDDYYDESFTMFSAIAMNEKYTLELRAEAYNMLGVIISGPAPYLSEEEDESGLSFFKKALQLDPKIFSAASNIVENYNSTPTSHHDKVMTRIACQALLDNHWEKLSEKEREKIDRIAKTFIT